MVVICRSGVSAERRQLDECEINMAAFCRKPLRRFKLKRANRFGPPVELMVSNYPWNLAVCAPLVSKLMAIELSDAWKVSLIQATIHTWPK
jgi:hypothetical protein